MRKSEGQAALSRMVPLFAMILMFGFTIVLAGAGCSDSGDPVGPDDGNGDTTSADSASFAADVQPILTARCAKSGCHVEPFPQAGLDLSDFASLNARNTSTDNRIFIPGDAANSLIVKRIEGTINPRMPRDGPPFLSAAQIKLIRDWIDQGAEDN